MRPVWKLTLRRCFGDAAVPGEQHVQKGLVAEAGARPGGAVGCAQQALRLAGHGLRGRAGQGTARPHIVCQRRTKAASPLQRSILERFGFLQRATDFTLSEGRLPEASM